MYSRVFCMLFIASNWSIRYIADLNTKQQLSFLQETSIGRNLYYIHAGEILFFYFCYNEKHYVEIVLLYTQVNLYNALLQMLN